MADLSTYTQRVPEGRDADVATWEATPTAANLATALSPDTTGTGNVVFANSPTLTGAPTAPTPSAGDNSTKIATTAFIQNLATATEFFVFVIDGESLGVSTGTNKVTFRMPYAATLVSVKATVSTPPTGSVITVDVNESGVSVLSTKLTIDTGEPTSATAATPAVISDSSLADDAEITIDVDTVGSTIAGAGLKVYLGVKSV